MSAGNWGRGYSGPAISGNPVWGTGDSQVNTGSGNTFPGRNVPPPVIVDGEFGDPDFHNPRGEPLPDSFSPFQPIGAPPVRPDLWQPPGNLPLIDRRMLLSPAQVAMAEKSAQVMGQIASQRQQAQMMAAQYALQLANEKINMRMPNYSHPVSRILDVIGY